MLVARLVFLLGLLDATDLFDFGVVNYRPQWIFHCLSDIVKRVDPPTNEQPLISYECPRPAAPIEILPVELDLTYLCRLDSRLFWFIVDLYQYEVFSWRLDAEQIEIRIEFNGRILLHDYQRETTNFTSRSILINAFYLPFEALTPILNESIDIEIVLSNTQRPNRCEFHSNDRRTWKTILDDQCQTSESHSLIVQHGECHFHVNGSHETADLNLVLAIDETNASTVVFPPHQHQQHFYTFLQENAHLIFSSLHRTKIISTLLKLSVALLVAILLTMILFFLYVLVYQHCLRRRRSTPIDRISLDI